jgi:hypothetical protein
MNILIVGAGAVGKVYGRHLALGGAKVSFYVKEKYAAAAREGFSFYPLNESAHRKTPLLWTDYSVYTTLKEVAEDKWDYVILAMSSTALRSGWIDEFLTAVPKASIVTLQPGMYDYEYMVERVAKERLIDGTIHIISWESPMPGESFLPGTAYWTPPGSFAAFSGVASRVDPLLAVFQKGHFQVKSVTDSRKINIAAGPILTLIIWSLEHSDWSLEKFKNGTWLKRACAAIPEAVAIQAKKSGVPVPATGFFKPFLFKAFLKFSKFIVPFNLEAYLKLHFTKVKDQTHESLDAMIQYGNENGLATEFLQRLKSET